MRRALVACALLASAAAHAQSNERIAAARELFDAGVALTAEGRLDEAAERFRASIEIHPSPTAMFDLAVVDVDRGRLVEALELFRQLAANEAAPAEVREEARSRAASLAPRIAHLTLAYDGDRSRPRVTLDARLLPPAAIGVALPVDPGDHRVEARLDEAAIARDVHLGSGESRELALEFPAAGVAPRGGSVLEEAWFWVLVGAVAIGAGIAITAGVVSSSGPMAGNIDPGVLVVP